MEQAQALGMAARDVAKAWPCAMTVWHRADGQRGIVVEYSVRFSAAPTIVVSFGPGREWEKCQACELSAVLIKGDPEDGDEWKEGAGHG